MKAPKEIYVPLVDMGVEEGGIQPAAIWWNKDKSTEKKDCKGVIRYVLADLSENDNEPKKGYDEKYLQSCIDKAKESWKGVDVDKFMNEIRGREDEPNEELDKAAIEAAQLDMCDRQIMEDSNEHRMLYSRIFRRAFKAGAEWQRERMLENAIEGIARPDDCEIWVNLKGYDYNYKDGDKVKLIIVKES